MNNKKEELIRRKAKLLTEIKNIEYAIYALNMAAMRDAEIIKKYICEEELHNEK